MKKGALEILKAARLHRTLVFLASLLVPASFADEINGDVLLMACCGVMVYAASGIANARKDGDYAIGDAGMAVAAMLLTVSILVSLSSIIVFAAVSISILMGIIYNYFARYFLFMDASVLAATHHALPVLFSSLALGEDPLFSVRLALYFFITLWFIIHLKNLKDKEDDRMRGYRTIANSCGRGRSLTIFFLEISFALMALSYFFFRMSIGFLALLVGIYLLKGRINSLLDENRDEAALDYMRLMVLLFISGFVFSKTSNVLIMIPNAGIILSYMLYIVTTRNVANVRKSIA